MVKILMIIADSKGGWEGGVVMLFRVRMHASYNYRHSRA